MLLNLCWRFRFMSYGCGYGCEWYIYSEQTVENAICFSLFTCKLAVYFFLNATWDWLVCGIKSVTIHTIQARGFRILSNLLYDDGHVHSATTLISVANKNLIRNYIHKGIVGRAARVKLRNHICSYEPCFSACYS